MKRKRLIYTILGLVAVAAVAGVIYWRTQAGQQSGEARRTATVRRDTLTVSVSTSGNIEPERRVDLTFEASGTVQEIPVTLGAPVEAGDVLAQLETATLELQVQQAQAGLDAAQAQLASLQAAPQAQAIAAAEANVETAQAQVSRAAAQLNQLTGGPSQAQLAAAEAQLVSAEVREEQAQEAHERTMECFTINIPPPYGNGEERTICPGLGAPEERARYNAQAAHAALEAARAQLEAVRSGPDADQIRAAEAQVRSAIAQREAAEAELALERADPTAAELEAARARVKQAQASLDQAQLSLDGATLRAPFDGVVGAIEIAEGQIVSSGQTAIVLADISRFTAEMAVDELDVAQLSEGQSAVVTLEALPDLTLEGRIARIAPAAQEASADLAASIDAAGTATAYDVTIALDPTDAPIRAGMTANATIDVSQVTDALVIPTWIVRVDRTTGQTYVHRPTGGEPERVDIEIGARFNGTVEVVSGLEEGDRLILVQQGGLGAFGGDGS